jgi:hypothetical protein
MKKKILSNKAKSDLNIFYFLLLVIIAFTFSVVVRSYWAIHFDNTENKK